MAVIVAPMRMLRLPDVLQRVGVHRATLYRWEQSGHFPARVQLGPHTIAWRAEEVEAWLVSRPGAVKRAG